MHYIFRCTYYEDSINFMQFHNSFRWENSHYDCTQFFLLRTKIQKNVRGMKENYFFVSRMLKMTNNSLPWKFSWGQMLPNLSLLWYEQKIQSKSSRKFSDKFPQTWRLIVVLTGYKKKLRKKKWGTFVLTYPKKTEWTEFDQSPGGASANTAQNITNSQTLFWFWFQELHPT